MIWVLFGLSLTLLSTPSARAEIGSMDTVPAATLLLPYFEVDLDDPEGRTTLFSVNNAWETPAIAHVTLWTDWSIPTLDFNVYLTGYDVASFNLRDLFIDGTIPGTSHRDRTVSPLGQFSAEASGVTGVGPTSSSCDDQLPLPALPAVLLGHIQAAHTGEPSPVFGGLCSGSPERDRVARGYITIDNVSFCTLDFPGDEGYFVDGGQGVANNLNQLWGDFFLSDGSRNFAQGFSLVHVEASDNDPRTELGEYTFYARFSGGADNREPLATTFAARFFDGGVFDGGTDLLVWRDSKRRVSPTTCGIQPSPFPLGINALIFFDEEENLSELPTNPFSPPFPPMDIAVFPYESQRWTVDEDTFGFIGFHFGWMYVDLNHFSGSPYDPIGQNWMGVIHSAEGRFSVGLDTVAYDNASAPNEAFLPVCNGDPDPSACP